MDSRKLHPRCAQWTSLVEWLSAAYPHDVPMPIEPGVKHPMFSHSGGKWTWENFQRFAGVRRGYMPTTTDIGILLHDLCVIDVDDVDIAARLEHDFPILLKTAREDTRKGRHYYFSRSRMADLHGYYDGRAPVMTGVDFKTRCATGTGGLILTAPSTHKTWVLAPWECPDNVDGRLPPIPDDLLRAVGVPKHQSVSAKVRFVPTGDTLEVRDNIWLPQFEYMAPFFAAGDDRFDADDIPLPFGTPQHLSDLLWLCEHGAVQRWPMDADAVHRLADFLGAPERIMKRVSPTHPGSVVAGLLSLESVDPDYAACAAAPRAPLVPVDGVLTRLLVYEPLPRDDRWLFHERSRAAGEDRAGERVLRDDLAAHAVDDLPPLVLDLLIDYPGQLVLAGGAALSLASAPTFAAGKCSPSDYDLFVTGTDAAGAAAILADACERAREVARTGAAVTLIGEDDVQVQIILRLFESPAHVLSTFDLAVCKVCCLCEDDRLRFMAAPGWVQSMRRQAAWLDVHNWSPASVSRALKYYSRGFEILVPALDRSAFRASLPSGSGSRGLASLFIVERAVEKSKKLTWFGLFGHIVRTHMQGSMTPIMRVALCERPSLDMLMRELKHVSRGKAWESGYAEAMNPGAMPHVIRNMLEYGMRWIGLKPVPARKASVPPGSDVSWLMAEQGKNLYPCSPRLGELYNLELMSKADTRRART